MKTIIIVISMVAFVVGVGYLASISKPRMIKSHYEWNVEVTYQNGDRDTLHCEADGYCCVLQIETSEPGFISPIATSPCLVIRDRAYKYIQASGVRKFYILSYLIK